MITHPLNGGEVCETPLIIANRCGNLADSVYDYLPPPNVTSDVPPVSSPQNITSTTEATASVTNSSGVDCNKDRYTFSVFECEKCYRVYNDGECFT